MQRIVATVRRGVRSIQAPRYGAVTTVDTIPINPCIAGSVREPREDNLGEASNVLLTWVHLIDQQGAGERPGSGAGGE